MKGKGKEMGEGWYEKKRDPRHQHIHLLSRAEAAWPISKQGQLNPKNVKQVFF